MIIQFFPLPQRPSREIYQSDISLWRYFQSGKLFRSFNSSRIIQIIPKKYFLAQIFLSCFLWLIWFQIREKWTKRVGGKREYFEKNRIWTGHSRQFGDGTREKIDPDGGVRWGMEPRPEFSRWETWRYRDQTVQETPGKRTEEVTGVRDEEIPESYWVLYWRSSSRKCLNATNVCHQFGKVLIRVENKVGRSLQEYFHSELLWRSTSWRTRSRLEIKKSQRCSLDLSISGRQITR